MKAEIFGQARDTGERVMCGKGRCLFVDLERAVDEEKVGIFDVLDYHTDSCQFWDRLFVPKKFGFKPEVEDLFEFPPTGMNLLVLSRLEILPMFRGRGLSKWIMTEMMRYFSGRASVVALKACPLQPREKEKRELQGWEADMGFEAFTTDIEIATRKLMDLYSELGFIAIDDDGFMVRAPFNECP